MKGFWKDFKAFISKGNIIDLAIAVVVGGAFGKIVTSLVNDVIMPLISFATGRVSVSDWKWVITPASEGVAESALYYGSFIQTILDFLIIAFFVFLAIRILQRSKTKLEKLTNEITKDIKKSRRRRRKDQKEAVDETLEEIQSNSLKEEIIEPIVSVDNEIITSLKAMSENSKKSNKTQENLLKEIRDLLKQNKDK